MEDGYKEVDFKTYCATCKFKKLEQEDTPCDECLEHPVNLHSHKPVKYIKTEKVIVKNEQE